MPDYTPTETPDTASDMMNRVADHALVDHTGIPGVGAGGGDSLPTGWTQDEADPANLSTGGGRLTGDAVTVNGASLELQAGLGATTYLYAAYGDVDGEGGEVVIVGGSGDAGSSDPAEIRVKGGAGDGTTAGKIRFITGGSSGVAGEALVSNGVAGSGARTDWGGIIVAEGAPTGAPAGSLPFAYDTTAVTGGFYFWNGSAWVKVADIL